MRPRRIILVLLGTASISAALGLAVVRRKGASPSRETQLTSPTSAAEPLVTEAPPAFRQPSQAAAYESALRGGRQRQVALLRASLAQARQLGLPEEGLAIVKQRLAQSEAALSSATHGQ